MLVSIIVPIYNVEEYIEDCLRSIVEQDCQEEIECVLVNDSTLDKSWILVQEFIANYFGRVKFVLECHATNLGLSAARNTGLMKANGEYVLFLDSDDKLAPNAVKNLVAPLTFMNYDVVVGAYSMIPSSTNVLFINEGEISTERIKQSYVFGEWYPMAWNKLCNRKFLHEQRLFFLDGLIHEDELWSFQLADKAKSMYIANAITYEYRVRENSIMSSLSANLDEKLSRKIILYNKLIMYICNKECNDVYDYLFLDQKLVYLLNDLYYLRTKLPSRKFYADIHQLFLPSFKKECICLSLKHFIRNFHLALPVSLGYLYWKIYRRFHRIFLHSHEID